MLTEKNLNCHVQCKSCELQIFPFAWNCSALTNSHLLSVIMKFKISSFNQQNEIF